MATSVVKILIQLLDWKSPGGQGDCRIGFSSAGRWKIARACFEFNSAIGLKGPRNLFLSLGACFDFSSATRLKEP